MDKSPLIYGADSNGETINNSEVIASVLRSLVTIARLQSSNVAVEPYIAEAVNEIITGTSWQHDLCGTTWEESPEGHAIYGLIHSGMAAARGTDQDLDRLAGAVVVKVLEHI